MVLDDLALKHNTDKGSTGHNYCPLYEKYLPKKVSKFLEIGCFKGAGIRMFKEWYNHEGMFYTMDKFFGHELIVAISILQAEGINCIEADQNDLWRLELIKDKFDVIIDDGSHHWRSQIVTFKRMFLHNLLPGGLYVIEDVFDEPYWGQGLIKEAKDNINGALRKYLETGSLHTEFISQDESDLIASKIKDVQIHNEIIFIKHG